MRFEFVEDLEKPDRPGRHAASASAVTPSGLVLGDPLFPAAAA